MSDRTIWKYDLPSSPTEFTLELPHRSQILDVQQQAGVLCMWVFIPNTEHLKEKRRFRIFGTGQLIHENENRLIHVKTYQTSGGLIQPHFVWHLFEIVKDGKGPDVKHKRSS